MTTPPHTNTDFERELDALAARLVAMGTRSEHQLAHATRAMIDRDDHAAEEVIAGDAAIDQDEKDIDDQAMRLLARWHPVARDLRVITMCLKAVTHLERIGDLAVDCAQRARELNRMAPLAWHFDIEPLALLVLRGLRAVVAALASQDAEAARRVLDEAAEADRLHAKLLAELLAHLATNPATITSVLPLTSGCRYLGHAADHVKSLAGEIIYMVSAEHVHHASV